MLLIAKRGWIDRGEPAHNGERRDLRLRREPTLDRRQMRIERGGHAYPFLVTPLAAIERPNRRPKADTVVRSKRARPEQLRRGRFPVWLKIARSGPRLGPRDQARR